MNIRHPIRDNPVVALRLGDADPLPASWEPEPKWDNVVVGIDLGSRDCVAVFVWISDHFSVPDTRIWNGPTHWKPE